MNLHYMLDGAWHSVIMIGHKPAANGREELFQIKDSIWASNHNAPGEWVRASWLLPNLYGAIGVTFADE